MDRGINTFAMHSGLSEEDFGWGSPTFHKMARSFPAWTQTRAAPCILPLYPSISAQGRAVQVIRYCKLVIESLHVQVRLLRNRRNVLCICMQGREKIHLIETFTDMGFDILVSDVDTVW